MPRGWAEDPRLGTWVNTQRKCKRKVDRGEPSPGMTVARAARLEALGFVWVAAPPSRIMHDAAWEVQLARLAAYKAEHGDCNVPARWAEDPRLGSWVVTQRQGKKALDRGEATERMTAARAARLEALGFVWDHWEAQLARLAVYKAVYGDCNVPKGWVEDPGLGY